MIEQLRSLFNSLVFHEDTHKYYLDSIPLRGVTTTIKDLYVKPFPYEVAKYSGAKRGLTQEEELFRWKEAGRIACEKGHAVHSIIENEIIDNNIKSFNIDTLLAQYNCVPVIPEFKVYSRKYNFAGTFDLLVLNNTTQEYEIWDWKTNKDIYKNFKFQALLPPFDDFLDMPVNHYKIQLAMYALCLIENGININTGRIVWITNNEVISYDMQLFIDRLKLTL